METTFPGNIALFNLINAAKVPNEIVVTIARGLAIYSPWLLIVILVPFWFLGAAGIRRALMISGVALGLGLAVNFSLAYSFYTPRPFALGIGNSFLPHGPETSFPSDHATFLWSLGLGLLLSRRLRWLGAGAVCLGLATAWARVYLGVHYPLDMAASFVISLLAAAIAGASAEKLDGIFFQPVERLNALLLRSVRRQGESRE